MRLPCLLTRLFGLPVQRYASRRNLLTLAIETSCDDTSVAILERQHKHRAVLHFHEKITSDNQSYGGVHPLVAHESHQKNLAALINRAVQKFPLHAVREYVESGHLRNGFYLQKGRDGHDKLDICRRKPDFITVTRGPGMRANLITGIDTAKGLAVAWQIPFLGVNHMQAHTLTPRLVSAIDRKGDPCIDNPAFPFLTLLVSGGHTMLVHSKGLCEHEILANTVDIAVGDMIDKCARDILPGDVLKQAGGVMYGPILEEFAFPDSKDSQQQTCENDRSDTRTFPITAPLQNHPSSDAKKYNALFSFSGIGSAAKRVMEQAHTMDHAGRQLLAQQVMYVAFKHLASRIVFALKSPELADLKTVVVSGGVASNQYLKRVIRTALDTGGHDKMELLFPPAKYCTDNAAMIAWTGMEMWDAGYRTSLDAMALKKWSIDPKAEDGGILGIDGWNRVRLKEGGNWEPIPLK